jgi:hypothetical protein
VEVDAAPEGEVRGTLLGRIEGGASNRMSRTREVSIPRWERMCRFEANPRSVRDERKRMRNGRG